MTGARGPGIRRRIAVFSRAELIGDGLFKLAFVRSLRAAFPHDEIVWITCDASVYAATLRDLARPYLDAVVEKTGLGESPLHVVAPPKLGLGAFDIVIDTQSVIARSIAARRALRPNLFITAAAGYRLSDMRPDPGDAKPVHLIDRLRHLASLAAGCPVPETEGRVRVDPRLEAAANAALPPGRHYVGFAPGSGDPTKRWPLERFIALAARQAGKGRTPVFFLGPAERDMAGQLRRNVPAALFPEQKVPPDTPKGPLLVIALAQRLTAAVANDSGVGHMLAAADVPLTLLYGRHDPNKYAPRVSALRTIWARDFGGDSHDLIPLDTVAAALDELIAPDAVTGAATERTADFR